MIQAIPIISSDPNGTQCYFQPGENMYVFRSENDHDFEECREDIVSDRVRLTESGSKCCEHILSEYSPWMHLETLLTLVCHKHGGNNG